MAVMTSELSGCSSPDQRKREAAEALGNKYQEEFEIISYKAPELLQDYYTVKAYSLDYPNLVFQAEVGVETGDVSDSYVTKRLCSRISEKISRNLGTLETDYYVFTEAMLDETVITDPEVSLADYMAEGPGNRFTVYFCIDKNGADAGNIALAAAGMFKDLPQMSGSLCIYLAEPELLADIQDYVESHDDTYTEFDEMTDEAYIGSESFENGGLSLTERKLKEMAGDRL